MPEPQTDKIDLGLMVEGIVELDPMSGRLVVRYEDDQGNFQFHDVQEYLLRYKGQEVRCIITPTATIAQLAKLVEQGNVRLEDIPAVPKFG